MKSIIDFEGERDFMKVVFKQWLSWCRGKKQNKTKHNIGNLQSEGQLELWQQRRLNIC